MGIQNDQAAIKIDFVVINQSYHDVALRRTFRASNATMFACDQPVLLPHVSRQKCTCMVGEKFTPVLSKGREMRRGSFSHSRIARRCVRRRKRGKRRAQATPRHRRRPSSDGKRTSPRDNLRPQSLSDLRLSQSLDLCLELHHASQETNTGRTARASAGREPEHSCAVAGRGTDGFRDVLRRWSE